jgi:O-antigen ligase
MEYNYNRILQYFIKYFFFLFPFFLISGPLLGDLFVIVIFCIFLFFARSFVYKNLINNHLFQFLILFYFYININSLSADFPFISLQTSMPYLRLIFFPFIIVFFLNIYLDLKKIIIFSFFVAYSVLLIDSLIQLTYGHNLIGIPLSPTDRVSSFFGSKLVMGSFVARTLPVILAFTFLLEFKYKKIFQVALLFIAGVLIFLSNERLASAYYLIIFIFYFLLNFKKKNYLLIILLFSFFFIFLSFLKPSSYQRLIFSTLDQFKQTKNIIFPSYRHELHYVTAYNIFKDKKIFGHGIKSFRFLCESEKYAPLAKIENDNKVYSQKKGYIFFEKRNEDYYAIIKKNLDKDDSEDYYYKLTGVFLKYYKTNGDYVNENELIFSNYEFANGCNTHPHNIHIQFLSELGILGYIFLLIAFSFLLIMILFIFFKYLRDNKLKNQELCLFFSMLGLLLSIFPFFPSGNFFNNWLSVIFYFNVASLLFSSNEK